MKKISFRKWITVLLCVAFSIALFACSSGSDDDDDNGSSGSENGSSGQNKTVLYYNSLTSRYEGSASWTATTITDKVLLGLEGDNYGSDFIESIEWCLHANGDEIWRSSYYGNPGRISYSIDTESATLTANLTVETNDFTDGNWTLKRWSQIPIVDVSVVINFTTGQTKVIATQSSYEYTKNYVSDYLRENSSIDYFYRTYFPQDNSVIYPAQAIGGVMKISSVVVYTSSGVYTATNDWSDYSFVRQFIDNTERQQGGEFHPTLWLFDLNSSTQYRYVITFLNGEVYERNCR